MQFLCDYCHKEFILPTNKKHMALLEEGLSEFQEQLNSSNKFRHIPFFMSYYSAFIGLLGTLCQNQNGANESKCQGYYPHLCMLMLIKKVDKYWPLKQELLFMYYHLYLDIQTREEDEEQIVSKIVGVIVQDLVYINKFHDDKKMKRAFMTRNGMATINKMIENYLRHGVVLALKEIIKISIVYKSKHLIE